MGLSTQLACPVRLRRFRQPGWVQRQSAGNCLNRERNCWLRLAQAGGRYALTWNFFAVLFCVFASSFYGCYDSLAALRSSLFRAATAPHRLPDSKSTYNLKMIRRDLSLALPIPWYLPQLQPGPSLVFLRHGPSVNGNPTLAHPLPKPAAAGHGRYERWPPRGGICPTVPTYGVAPDRRPSLGVSQWPRPLPVAGRWLGGCRIRPQPIRRPGSWALTAGPGGALLARRLALGRLATRFTSRPLACLPVVEL